MFHVPKFLRGFRAILFKEFITILRDRTTLYFMFFPPLLQIIAFGNATPSAVFRACRAIVELEPSISTCTSAFCPARSLRVKSGGI